MKIGFYTLGCKVNQYETEAISQIFKQNNWDIGSFDETCDAYLINTCTVTSLSDRKSRQMIRRAKKINPQSIIAVCGCYAQTAPKEIEKLEEVDIIIGTKDKIKSYELITKALLKREKISIVSDLNKDTPYDDMSLTYYESKTRAILKVQDGCNNYCSYCIIPYARGPIRSKPLDKVYEECVNLSKNGFSEIVLAGIHICLYGKDLKNTSLIDLIEKIHGIDGILRIRLSSIEPNAFTDDFLNRITKLPKLCHHFHISLQSGCDETLKRMNRKYSSQFYKELCDKLINMFPDIAITTDIIVGFPGETDEEFQATLEFLKSINFYQIHTFKYSIRDGTKAALMDNQVDPKIKDARSKEVLNLSNKATKLFHDKFIGANLSVLFEKKHNEYFLGHTSNYLPVYVETKENLEGEFLNVNIKNSLNAEGLLGGIINE